MMMMMMTMKERPIGKCRKLLLELPLQAGASSLEIAYKEVLFNIIKPSPPHVPLKNR